MKCTRTLLFVIIIYRALARSSCLVFVYAIMTVLSSFRPLPERYVCARRCTRIENEKKESTKNSQKKEPLKDTKSKEQE